MANCGECLMEAIEVVELKPDGTCPRCGGNYSKGISGEQPSVDDDGPDTTSDAVLSCHDCDRPNQFGQVCDSCARDREEEAEAAY